ncbi:MAG TPA: ABC transporter substrate-binding protein [Gemmatimonadaceae bacterium]|nr:ABC transporter substrate-binding protein [Gemmatimonadaceae bacterium]
MPFPIARLRQPRRVRAGASLVAAGVVALLAAGCSRRGSTDQVAIGLAAQAQSPTNLSTKQGAELAIARLNEQRPRGAPRFILRTVPSSLELAVPIATALRDDPDVVGVVGHTDSRSSLESVPVYEDVEHGGENAVVAISPVSTTILLSGRSRWVFRVCPNDTVNSRAAARFALDSLHSRRATMMYRNDVYGTGWSRAFTANYEAGGGAVVGRAPHLARMTEWDAYAGLIRKQAPDLVLFPGGPQDAETLIRDLRALGSEPRMIGGDGFSTMEEHAKEFAGVYYISFFLPTRPPNDQAREFVAEFQRRYRLPPDQRAALAYDATMLIGRAVMAVGPDRAKIRDWVEEIGSKRPAMVGVTGPIAFDANHDVVDKPVIIARVGGS